MNSTQEVKNNRGNESRSKNLPYCHKHTKADAKARRKVAKNWAFLAQTTRYQKAASKASCIYTTKVLGEELFDGILLKLNERNSKKSYSAQKRILRRIVEKRQAQATFQKIGRSENRFTVHLLRHCACKSMGDLRRKEMCA